MRVIILRRLFVWSSVLMLIGGFFILARVAEAAVLSVDYIEQTRSASVADNTWANGWQWKFYLTVPENETVLKIKFADLTSGTNSIPATNNIRCYSDQSLNASPASPKIIASAGAYGEAMNLDPAADLNGLKPGRQIQITVETKIPSGTPAGAYSGDYGIDTADPSALATVISVASVPSTNVALGTPIGNLYLPSLGKVTLGDGREINALITNWSEGTPAYNGAVPGTYQFFGSFSLPSGITNPNNLKAVANFIVNSPSQSGDATLSQLTISYGLNNLPQILPFNAPVSLTMTLPLASVTGLPVVSAIANDSGASIAISQISNLPGAALVVVTARDGVTKNTYIINFTGTLLSSTPILSLISVSPSSLSLFAGENRPLTAVGVDQYGNPFTLPSVSWSSNYPEIVTVNQSTGAVSALSAGSATITAASGLVSGSASITVSIPAGAANDATLSSLIINYSSVFYGNSTFTMPLPLQSGNFSYSVGLIPGTNIAAITAVSASQGAQVTINNPATLPGTATVNVTSRDGTVSNTYTIEIQVQ